MTSKDGEKTRGFLAFRRRKDKVPSTTIMGRQSSHSSSKNQGKRLVGNDSLKPRNAVISKSGNFGTNNRNNNILRRVTKATGPQEVHWYPFYVAVFHDPPDDYYADTSKEELWWSREFLEQRLFESLAGIDEEDREHKHRLLQMGQDVVPTRRRSHESVVVGIVGDTSSAYDDEMGSATTTASPEVVSAPIVLDQVELLEEALLSSSTVKGVDTDADQNDEKEREEDKLEQSCDGSYLEDTFVPELRGRDHQMNSNEHSDERRPQTDDIAEHEQNILEQTHVYVKQYNELLEKGENVSSMMTPQQVIAAAQKMLQCSQSPPNYRNQHQWEPGEDDNMAENERKILDHTRAYVKQYNELARIGMNLQGMVTPEEAIAAAQALLGGRNTGAKEQKQQLLLHEENFPKMMGGNHHFGVPTETRSHAPNTPQFEHLRMHPFIPNFSSNFHPINEHFHRGTQHHHHHDLSTRTNRSHGGRTHGLNEFHDSQTPIPSNAVNLYGGPLYTARPDLKAHITLGSCDFPHPIDFHARGIDPLDRRFWRASTTNRPSSLKRDRNTKKLCKVRWPKEYITLIGEPIYVIFDPREMWWTGPELHYIDMENQRELEMSESAFVFDQECEVVFDRVIDECQVFQDRRRNPLRDFSALWNPKHLRKFLTPKLIQGLANGHRGLELDGLEGRREKTEEQYRIVFNYIACNFYEVDNRMKKNRQEMGLSNAASDATLCDRVFAYIMGLADEMIVSGFDSQRMGV